MNKMTALSRIFLSLIGLGVTGSLIGAGTFASFNTQATNTSNAFSTGTLVLSQTSGGLTPNPCFSTTDRSASGQPATTTVACGAFFSVANLKPGDTDTSSTITITNQGSLPSAVTLALTCTDGNASTLFNGTASLCAQLEMSVQAKNTSTGTVIQCVYGNLASTNTCDLNGAGFTPGSYGVAARGLTSASGGTWSPGASVQYVFGVALPATAGSTSQGRQTTIGLTWTASQS